MTCTAKLQYADIHTNKTAETIVMEHSNSRYAFSLNGKWYNAFATVVCNQTVLQQNNIYKPINGFQLFMHEPL